MNEIFREKTEKRDNERKGKNDWNKQEEFQGNIANI